VEDAVDTEEPRCIRQNLLGKALRALRVHQRGDERDGIIRQRRRAHRILIVAGAVRRGEIAEARLIRRGKPSAL
jgi:hypothetical protein